MAEDTAVNNGDIDGANKILGSELSAFAGNGGLLIRASGIIQNISERDYEIQHLEVKVYDNTAVATYYRSGTGPLGEGTYRMTMVLNKQAGQWKQVHRHESRLMPQGDQ